MRLFLAIFPPDDLLESFVTLQHMLAQYKNYVRFTKRENIHLTLRFFGDDVSETSISIISQIIPKHSGITPFNVQINEIRYGFPGRRWPKILYVSIRKNAFLDKIVSGINREVEGRQLPDVEPYARSGDPVYHFTIGRTSGRLTKNVISQVRNQLETMAVYDGFRVQRMHLVESQFAKAGPRYSILRTFDFSST